MEALLACLTTNCQNSIKQHAGRNAPGGFTPHTHIHPSIHTTRMWKRGRKKERYLYSFLNISLRRGGDVVNRQLYALLLKPAFAIASKRKRRRWLWSNHMSQVFFVFFFINKQNQRQRNKIQDHYKSVIRCGLLFRSITARSCVLMHLD